MFEEDNEKDGFRSTGSAAGDYALLAVIVLVVLACLVALAVFFGRKSLEINPEVVFTSIAAKLQNR